MNLFSPGILKFLTVILVAGTWSCNQSFAPTDLASEPLIPLPVSVTSDGNLFQLRHDMDIYIQADHPAVAEAGQYLVSILRPATGFDLEIKPTPIAPSKGHIYMHLDSTQSDLGAEGYVLDISDSGIELRAVKP